MTKVWVALIGLTLVGIIGVAHTSRGRALLGHAGCPLGYGQADPEAKQRARSRFAEAHAGTVVARARPALGFQLDVTTQKDVHAWAKSHGARCSPRAGADLECVSDRTLWMYFDTDDRLVSLTAIRRESSATAISDAFATTIAQVTAAAGPPTRLEGEASAAKLSRGALRQASAEYRYRNYYARMRATNLGSGFALTEEYHALSADRAARASTASNDSDPIRPARP